VIIVGHRLQLGSHLGRPLLAQEMRWLAEDPIEIGDHRLDMTAGENHRPKRRRMRCGLAHERPHLRIVGPQFRRLNRIRLEVLHLPDNPSDDELLRLRRAFVLPRRLLAQELPRW
jgi:hypothetical protein